MEISKEMVSMEIGCQESMKEGTDKNERQDTTLESPSLYPTFFHARDDDFTTQTWRIKSEVQAGHVFGGHYLRINGSKVSADAARNDSKAQFKIHCYYDDRLDRDLWIFESASDGKFIAIENDRIVVKSVQTSLTSIVHVKATNPEILFVKKPLSPGSTVFTLRLYSSSTTKYYLGFDNVNGSAMIPSKVRPTTKEAKFRIV
ncbi:uncharacterized protein LOC116302599 [Actinia tenebrosa]|uniref:Uncharacterized protein LOC116302599 n=1 Tax=Actinia tenebrosa TaxID=6105 RepID=A0A6P8ILX5_ACTTE|nr:uncharacterized protein LOC116302599 [Actinia tenebrosa]